MSGKNKFGFAPLEDTPKPAKRDRAPGPMGAAVRDAAETLQGSTEAKVDLSRFSAAPSARLSHLSFEGDRAFPAEC
jgi:ParB family chromosome partitioning protein